jgi:orotidine-5'-phosphate decarboxylase
MHFADRLFDAVRSKKTPLCVGLDPRWESLPERIRLRHGDTLRGQARAFEEFCRRVLDIVSPLVGVVKPQSAFFEACGPDGMQALRQVMRHAKHLGLVTILDAKRNDIASTAEAYAEAAFRVYDADAVTINPYLGRDSIEPFLKIGRPLNRGVFVLVRTSNPGSNQFQGLECGERAIYLHVGDAVRKWTEENLGACGFGDVGAVVGATQPAELSELRLRLTTVPFLVPGFGAQGGTAADTAGAFQASGLGAVVNSSRGVIFPSGPGDSAWETAVARAASGAIRELSAGTPAGQLGG